MSIRRSSSPLPLTVAFALLALGCGGADDKPTPAITGCSQRLTELLDGACKPVEVLAVQQQDITFERDGLTLFGTISWPETAGEYHAPGVVVIHGSGPHGRDGTLDGVLCVPFGQDVAVYRDLAEKLAWRGIATLRYDKRTCFHEANDACAASVADYPDNLNDIRVDDFVEDARAAAHALAQHPAVNADDIVVAGHSQGGNFVPRLVNSEPFITAGIGLAAPALGLTETIVGQLQVCADHLASVDPQYYASAITQYEQLADDYAVNLPTVLDGSYGASNYQGVPLGFWQSWGNIMASSEQDIMATDEPLLYLSGQWDFNVWPEHLAQLDAWGQASPGRVDTQLLSGLTHAFVPISGTPPADMVVDPQFSPAALDAIVNWLSDYRSG